MSPHKTAASLNRSCRELAKRLLLLIEADGKTYETAMEIDRRISLLYARAEKTQKKPRESSERFIGMIEAKCSLILPMHIMRDTKNGKTSDELRLLYPKYEISLPEGWEECLLNLREVAGLAVPMTVFVRDRAKWIGHYRYIWHNPGCTDKERRAVIRIAKKKYPDINITEITSGES